jgi:hypothetical protein
VLQVKELQEARAGKREGILAALVREAAAPGRERDDELAALRAEAERQRLRADEVRVASAFFACSRTLDLKWQKHSSKLCTNLHCQCTVAKGRDACVYVSVQIAETAGRQTRALMQQHERLKAELGARAAAGDRRAAPRRVHELERQLEDVRAHYQKKVRGLQMQLDAGTLASRPPSGTPSGARRTDGRHIGKTSLVWCYQPLSPQLSQSL